LVPPNFTPDPIAIRGQNAANFAPTYQNLRSLGSVQAYRNLYMLPYDSHIDFDRITLAVGVEELRLVSFLSGLGLIHPYPQWLQHPLLQNDAVSRSGEAYVSMELDAPIRDGRQDRLAQWLPIPAIMAGFKYTMRQGAIAQGAGMSIDTTEGEERVRRVQERIEDIFINGISSSLGGYNIKGLLNAPNANTTTFGSNLAWDDATKTGQGIFDDVSAMKAALQADGYYGGNNRYVLLTGTSYGNALDKDFKANGNYSIRARLLGQAGPGTGGIENLSAIMTIDRFPQHKVVLFQATSNVLQVVVGQDATVLSYTGNPMHGTEAMALACIIPRVRTDYDGGSGICIGTPT
jgi:hypothetical protein